MTISRRSFLARTAASGVAVALMPELLAAQGDDEIVVTHQMLEKAEALAGVQFTGPERELMMDSVKEHLGGLKAVQDMGLANGVFPAMTFQPQGKTPAPPGRYAVGTGLPRRGHAGRRPRRQEDLLFAPVSALGDWLASGQLTSTELTHMVLRRLERLNDRLEAVITFTKERALEQAAQADAELASGRRRGPLHGIPWGAKDLLAVKGAPTTWGAMPYRDRVIDDTAEVVRRLDDAGAVLVAKTSVGALAWGDVWFGGMTKNPWNLEQGSSGSSAGSAAAVAAGALPFALGTETLGSIVSPCTRCGATGLRPTFGRVPRTGCMALTWSMDKIGPIARSVADTDLVLQAIHGAHAGDPDSRSVVYSSRGSITTRSLRVGYDAASFESEYDHREHDQAVLEKLRALGFELIAVELPDMPLSAMLVVLEVEAAAAFDDLTRSNRDDELVRQVEQAWPNIFRAAQLVPAVQYVQAQRARRVLMQRFEEAIAGVDVYVAPTYAGPSLLATNLTGHPCAVLPNGFREDGTPTSITFLGQLYQEGAVAAVAAAYQQATDWHLRRPVL